MELITIGREGSNMVEVSRELINHPLDRIGQLACQAMTLPDLTDEELEIIQGAWKVKSPRVKNLACICLEWILDKRLVE